MLYCPNHDFGFCEKHKADCFDGERCELVQEPRALFCAICSGLLRPEPVKRNPDVIAGMIKSALDEVEAKEKK
jgi:hypothetical protein